MEVYQTNGIVLTMEHLVIPYPPEGEHTTPTSLTASKRGLCPLFGYRVNLLHRNAIIVQYVHALNHLGR
jgi:hypothetical protein